MVHLFKTNHEFCTGPTYEFHVDTTCGCILARDNEYSRASACCSKCPLWLENISLYTKAASFTPLQLHRHQHAQQMIIDLSPDSTETREKEQEYTKALRNLNHSYNWVMPYLVFGLAVLSALNGGVRTFEWQRLGY
jgi:uncharacterized membrane protein YraQ (UPF0718 family)